MKVEILRDTVVRHPKGEIVEVSEQEAARLIVFGNAKKVEVKAEAPAPAKKPAAKKSTKKEDK